MVIALITILLLLSHDSTYLYQLTSTKAKASVIYRSYLFIQSINHFIKWLAYCFFASPNRNNFWNIFKMTKKNQKWITSYFNETNIRRPKDVKRKIGNLQID